MKTKLLAAAFVLGSFAASAQAVQQPGFFDNWSLGLDGGVTTPMEHHAFFGDMRGIVGLRVQKQITPAFAMGVESAFGVNTSSWLNRVHSTTAFDDSYVGLYGAVDLFNLFGGYDCRVRPFNIEAVVGAGWGHEFINHKNGKDWNYFATKAGLNFNFNVSKLITLSLKPSVNWNMTGGNVDQTSVAYDVNKATFNFMAGVTFNFGNGFECVRPYDQAEVDELNAKVNALRGQLDACVETAAAWQAKANALGDELEACKNRKPEVIVEKEVEVSNNLNSVRFVFFRVGARTVASDQMPNVEMIADYMKHHPKANVVIKGYASPEGNYEKNVQLAKDRAESVKSVLIKKFRIDADRISAEGQGIGNMFEESSWNRVSICTLEETETK